MKLQDSNDPAVKKFLGQCFEDEIKLRVAWNNRFPELLKKAVEPRHDAKHYVYTDPLKRSIEMQLPIVAKSNISNANHKYVKPYKDSHFIEGVKKLRHEHNIEKLGLGNPKDDPRLDGPEIDPTSDPVMRLMDPKTRRILYKYPPPKRQIYLELRRKLLPEERYYLPQTAAMEIGWRLQDNVTKQGPRFGRINGCYKTRVGPQVDPPHYQEIPRTLTTRCKFY